MQCFGGWGTWVGGGSSSGSQGNRLWDGHCLEEVYCRELWGSGLPLWLSWQRICLWYGRPRFDPWVGKIPWRRERLPTPVFWPGECHGLYSPWGGKESDTTERLSLHWGSTLRGGVEGGWREQDWADGGLGCNDECSYHGDSANP